MTWPRIGEFHPSVSPSFRGCYGPKFTGRPLDQRAYLNMVEPQFSRSGKPSDNAYAEAFNGRVIPAHAKGDPCQLALTQTHVGIPKALKV